MNTPFSLAPRVTVLLVVGIIGLFAVVELRAKQQVADSYKISASEPWFWAKEAPPQRAFALSPAELRAVAVEPAMLPFVDTFQVSMVALFSEPAQAVEASGEVSDLLRALGAVYAQPAQAIEREQLLAAEQAAPLSAVEAAFFAAHGVNSAGIGIGWPGPQSTVTNTIQTFGPLLLIRGLKENLVDERRNPLETFLKQSAELVLLENDRSWGGVIAVDVACHTHTPAAAVELEQALQAYGFAPYYFYLRPPWQPPALSTREVNARRTYYYLEARMADLEKRQAYARLETAVYERYLHDENNREKALYLLRAHLQRAQLTLLDTLQQEPSLDADIVAHYRKTLQEEWRDFTLDGLAFGNAMGQVQLSLDSETQDVRPRSDTPAAAAFMEAIAAEENQLAVGSILFERFAVGFPLFMQYLVQQDCTNLTFSLADFDQVRGN